MKKKMLAVIGALVLVLAVALAIVFTRGSADPAAPTATAQPTEATTEAPAGEPTAEFTAESTVALTVAPTAAPLEVTAETTQAMAEETMELTEAPVDDFTVTLTTGETFTLSDYRGKVVVVDLWATWCPPCVASMPTLQKLANEYEGQVVILGVNCGDSADTVKSFVEKNGYTFPIAVDEKLDILYNHFYTSGIPYTVFIDANGALYDTHLGGGDVYNEMKDLIEGALARTPVENGQD